MQKLIVLALLLSLQLCKAQFYTSISIDPNILSGNEFSMTKTPGLNYKLALGYHFCN